jgi:hypothetical protein
MIVTPLIVPAWAPSPGEDAQSERSYPLNERIADTIVSDEGAG